MVVDGEVSSTTNHVLLMSDSLFGWLVADGWCWFVLREEYCWLVAGGWFVLREKYCWLVADKSRERGVNSFPPLHHRGGIWGCQCQVLRTQLPFLCTGCRGKDGDVQPKQSIRFYRLRNTRCAMSLIAVYLREHFMCIARMTLYRVSKTNPCSLYVALIYSAS
jgi:hypothetical protein